MSPLLLQVVALFAGIPEKIIATVIQLLTVTSHIVTNISVYFITLIIMFKLSDLVETFKDFCFDFMIGNLTNDNYNL